MMDVDREDRVRDLRGTLQYADSLAASAEFQWFLTLVDRRIERERTALEKGGDAITMNTIVGKIAGLRVMRGILADEQTTIKNEIRNQGGTT